MKTDEQREYQRVWYKENAERRRAQIRANFARLRKWLDDYKATLQCSQCGFNNPLALDFHHRLPEEKSYNVSQMVQRGFSIEAIKAEIEKCDVLCANCHRILHGLADGRAAPS